MKELALEAVEENRRNDCGLHELCRLLVWHFAQTFCGGGGAFQMNGFIGARVLTKTQQKEK